MARIAYVNGRYVPVADAVVSINDRGLQFADSVYEVIACHEGKFLEYDEHLARLERSLTALEMDAPVSFKALHIIIHEVCRRNRLKNGLVYLQVTRGTAPRLHRFPSIALPTTLIVTATPKNMTEALAAQTSGIKVITLPDERWNRRDIKTTNLLPNILAKQAAANAGAKEAWLVDSDGQVTEGSSSTAWIITANRVLLTRPLSTAILPGVTRAGLKHALADEDVTLEERSFSVDEAEAAVEAFITSANNPVTPVVKINASILGDGAPGPITQWLQQRFQRVRS